MSMVTLTLTARTLRNKDNIKMVAQILFGGYCHIFQVVFSYIMLQIEPSEMLFC